MNMIQSLIIMLSMYTVVPMPMVEWNEKNLKYCMAFLPAAGILIAALEYLLFFICRAGEISSVLYGTASCALPVLLTGGIHADGLIDTSDAVGSHGTKEKRMRILDDPHVGAFGTAGAIIYFLLAAGVMSELYERMTFQNIIAVLSAFLISRAAIAVMIMTLEPSKKSGLLYTFSSAGSRPAVCISAAAVLAICFCLIFYCFGRYGLISSAGFAVLCAYFVRMVRRQFGGLSGDLCGWFIHMAELVLFLCFMVTAVVK